MLETTSAYSKKREENGAPLPQPGPLDITQKPETIEPALKFQIIYQIREQFGANPLQTEPTQRNATSRVGYQEWRILRYNVPKSRDVILASLVKDPWILEYHA